MKAWLKGGLIAISILLGLTLLLGTINAIVRGGECSVLGYSVTLKTCYSSIYFKYLNFIPNIFLTYTLIAINILVYDLSIKTLNIISDLFYVVDLLFWFGIGALIGWRVEKIKSRNSSPNKINGV